jgi:hypothetical protein
VRRLPIAPTEPVVVGAAAAHRADVRRPGAQRHLEQRHVELGVVGEHADHRPRVDRHALQVLMRPLDDKGLIVI